MIKKLKTRNYFKIIKELKGKYQRNLKKVQKKLMN